MDNIPLITTLIPTHRRPHFLKKAIRSVLNQTFPDFQILVLDNASYDGTEELVKKMAEEDPRIQFCGSEILLPAVENFQRGLNRVQTPYFSILADDDLLLPNFYQTALHQLDQSPSSFFFMGSIIDIEENGRIIHESAVHWPNLDYFPPPTGVYEILRHYVNWTGSLFRKEISQTFKLDLNVKAIDFDFVLRVASQHPFSFSKTPCALFVQHAQSHSNYCGSKLVWPGSLKTLETLTSHRSLTATEKSKIKSLMGEYLQRTLFRIAVRSLYREDLSEVAKIAEIFRKELKKSKTSYLLKTLLFFCRSRKVLKMIQKAYQLLLNKKRNPLQHRYKALEDLYKNQLY